MGYSVLVEGIYGTEKNVTTGFVIEGLNRKEVYRKEHTKILRDDTAKGRDEIRTENACAICAIYRRLEQIINENRAKGGTVITGMNVPIDTGNVRPEAKGMLGMFEI